MLNGARKRFSNFKNIQLLKADAAQLPFSDSTFESINIANAIHCLPDVLGSVKEMHRVLKKDGCLAGNCLLYPRGQGFFSKLAMRINNWGMRKGILYRPYHADEIHKLLLETGFTLVFEKITGNCYDIVAKK